LGLTKKLFDFKKEKLFTKFSKYIIKFLLISKVLRSYEKNISSRLAVIEGSNCLRLPLAAFLVLLKSGKFSFFLSSFIFSKSDLFNITSPLI
jgi:hypothetical protein